HFSDCPLSYPVVGFPHNGGEYVRAAGNSHPVMFKCARGSFIDSIVPFLWRTPRVHYRRGSASSRNRSIRPHESDAANAVPRDVPTRSLLTPETGCVNVVTVVGTLGHPILWPASG